jgi:hypothetical protein
VEWDVFQKVESKREMKQRNVFGHHVTHGDQLGDDPLKSSDGQ